MIEQLRLGTSGLHVSRIALGMMSFGDKSRREWAEGPNGRGLSRKHVMAAIDASLERLGMDYVDLIQVHRFDTQTPVEETMEALDDVVKSGKAPRRSSARRDSRMSKTRLRRRSWNSHRKSSIA
jgi:aryl-alcohol dehydrogenase-like predicted oxidoreductase